MNSPKTLADYKHLLDEVSSDIQNYQGQSKCYQPKLKAEAGNA